MMTALRGVCAAMRYARKRAIPCIEKMSGGIIWGLTELLYATQEYGNGLARQKARRPLSRYIFAACLSLVIIKIMRRRQNIAFGGMSTRAGGILPVLWLIGISNLTMKYP